MVNLLSAIHRVKASIENRTDLSLGDVVNLALFMLTIVSLVFAVMGVWIAQTTLSDARESGAKQERSLDESRTALVASEASLAKVQKDIANQQLLLSENIRIATAQQQLLKANIASSLAQQHLLEEGTRLSNQQLTVARQQNERQLAELARKPNLDWHLTCWMNDASFISVHLEDLRNDQNHPRWTIPRQPDGVLRCDLYLDNKGDKVLEKASIEVFAFNPRDIVAEQSRHPLLLLPRFSAGQNDDWEQAKNSRLKLLDNQDILPDSLAGFRTLGYDVRVPSTVGSFAMYFEIQGQNSRKDHGQINVEFSK